MQQAAHPYRTFVAMVLAASVLMFALMYLNTYRWDHVWFSQTRLFMTLIMAGAMALVMLVFMRHMYRDKRANAAIVAASLALMATGLWLVRLAGTPKRYALLAKLGRNWSTHEGDLESIAATIPEAWFARAMPIIERRR